ncbi:MAG: type I-E CRISPR-associated protein Cas7/Cse4/CasC [Verrucomicrobia bacterium]|nr:type I-E CRISPR-associated protein Cas7/Cse4/CasC [Verrucomicrobiota bacterium]
MKLIELHILQSFPVSCLNRDDVGSPKTAVFGGVNRARLSSQSLKRAIREYAQDNLPDARFGGERTKLLALSIQKVLQDKHKVPEQRALELACAVAGVLNKKDGKPLPVDSPEMETLYFTSPKQTEAMADLAFSAFGLKEAIKPDKKGFVKAILDAGFGDAADIAIFGRMVAADSSLTLEGAAMFSHALSTHKCDNDLDYFAAVDECQPKTQQGAAHIDSLQFSSAVYYRYAAVNLDLLADQDHLAKLATEERRKVVNAFIRATLLAVPGARKNSMNAHTLPGYVLGTFKSAGQPVQLINAFENPVRPKFGAGLLEPSIEALKLHHAKLKETWGITCDTEVAIPDSNLNAFCEALTQHVR